MSNMTSIIKELIAGLSTRQKDILRKRFSLSDKPKGALTLAELGKSYGVTRERIRQIEAGALGAVRRKILSSPSAMSVLAVIHKHVQREVGVIREASLVDILKNELRSTPRPQELLFILEAEGRLTLYPEDNDFYSFWYKDNESLADAKNTIERVGEFFGDRKQEMLEWGAKAYDKLSGSEKAKLAISKKFGSNVYGNYGLMEWPEINPKTIRDRSYLVLKKFSRPTHFREIARLISECKFDEKPVFASTVHNELIKDRRFVLVGRGVYALSEQGYSPGTTREVIAGILRSKGPLRANEVVRLVAAVRQFKESTILLNLHNREYFRRLNDGRYHVNEA